MESQGSSAGGLGRSVLTEMRAVERHRTAQAVAEADGRRPARGPLESGRVRIEGSDVDAPLLIGPLNMFERPAARDVDQQGGEVAMSDGLTPADVEDLAVARVAGARAQKRIRRVIHVHEIADLRAVAENLNLAPFDGLADEPADEPLAAVPDELARPVDVGQPQRARADAVHTVVDEMVILAGRLVDPVDVRRPHEV